VTDDNYRFTQIFLTCERCGATSRCAVFCSRCERVMTEDNGREDNKCPYCHTCFDCDHQEDCSHKGGAKASRAIIATDDSLEGSD
jgi:hypothetical protein